jgi:YidC/Oxa1 family membrane protein insertase
MDYIYTAISAILLFWHAVWDKVVPKAAVVGTNWQWVLAIMCLVITIRVILFPIFVKQIKSQRAMQALQPKVKELQAKYKDDKETMQKELMQLYRTEKANPLMGCLPMVLQIPVFWGLYHVLRRLDPARHLKTLYGWTATQFDSAAHAKLFGVPLAAKFQSAPEELSRLGATGHNGVKIVAAVLVIMMMSTTFLSSRQMILKTGWSEDPQQKMMQRLMLYGFPLSILFYGWTIPIGVIIYWVVQNLFSLGQQHWVLSKYPPPAMSTNGKAPAPKPATSSGSFLRRRAKEEPKLASPVVDTKALAPKVGAKPVNPKKGGAKR